MTPEQFKNWRAHMGFSQARAAEVLDMSEDAIGYYDLGRRRDGRAVVIPKTVELACAALALGVFEYAGPGVVISRPPHGLRP